MRPNLSVIIPAYNEEARLEPTLHQAVEYFTRSEWPVEILVVDDGSRDGTALVVDRVARAHPQVKLLRLPANRGKGYAVRAGVINSVGTYVLFADADAATPFEEIEKLYAAIVAGAHVAIGSRAIRSAGSEVRAKLYRKIIGRGFHLLVRTLTVRGIADTQCGFKLFRGEIAQELFARMRMNGFSFDVEVLLMAQRGGYTVAEVPVNWTHQPGSRVNIATDSLRMARDLFVIRSHLLRGWYDQPHVAAPYRGEALVGSVDSSQRASISC